MLESDAPKKAAGPAMALALAASFLVLTLWWWARLRCSSCTSARERARNPGAHRARRHRARLRRLGYAIATGDTSGAGGTRGSSACSNVRSSTCARPGFRCSSPLLPTWASGAGRLPLGAMLEIAAGCFPLGVTWYAARPRLAGAASGAGDRARRAAAESCCSRRCGRLPIAITQTASARHFAGGGGTATTPNAAMKSERRRRARKRRRRGLLGGGRGGDEARGGRAGGAKDARAQVLARLPEKLNLVSSASTPCATTSVLWEVRPIAPNLDRLVKKSVLFEKAYSLASYTSKSLPPMLIGKCGSETHSGWTHYNRFGKEDRFVQERIQAAGIRTISVQGFWILSGRHRARARVRRARLSAAPKASPGGRRQHLQRRQDQRRRDRSAVQPREHLGPVLSLGPLHPTAHRIRAPPGVRLRARYARALRQRGRVRRASKWAPWSSSSKRAGLLPGPRSSSPAITARLSANTE